MKIRIAENIRTLRKEHRMTQEQLAEALGVTIGAVSKWESGACMPDIGLIVEMACFFETSVDVLLGYDLEVGGMARAVAHIKELRNEKRFDEAAAEAEQALQKYPNNFEIVYGCALLYCMMGIERRSEKALRRSLELYERSLTLLSQNTNPRINDWTIKNNMAGVYLTLEQNEEALERMKANNADGLNDGDIGRTLACSMHRPDEAMPYLSDALLDGVLRLYRVVTGYINAYLDQEEHTAALEIADWMQALVNGLKKPNERTYLDMLTVQLFSASVEAAAKAGDMARVRSDLRQAKVAAERFDADPAYSFDGMRFFHGNKATTAFSDFGETAIAGVERMIQENDETAEEIGKIWTELTGRTINGGAK